MIPLTERLLNDAGGWQAMKAARGLQAAGRVTEATYDAPILRGLVREGNTQYRAGLRIGSKTDIENLCACRDSKQRGLICAHSLAVGLEILKPTPAAPAVKPVERSPETASAGAGEGVLKTTCGMVFGDPAGQPLEFCFLLAPNFAEGWQRGAISVGVEAMQKNGSRVPIGTLRAGGRFAISDADKGVLAAILKLTHGEKPTALSLRPSQAELVIGALIGHPGVSLGRGKTVRIEEAQARIALAADSQPDGSLRLAAKLPADRIALLGGSSVWLWDAAAARLERAIQGIPAAYLELFRQPSVAIPASGAEVFASKELPALRQWFALVDMPVAAAPVGNRTDTAETQFFLKLEGSLNYLAAELEARTGDRRATITSQGYRASNRAEMAALARLRAAGFDGPNAKGEWVLRGEPVILGFFGRDLPGMEKDWQVTIGTRFEHVTKDLDRVQPRFEVRGSGQNWFEVSFDLATDSGERLSAADIRRLLATGQKKIRLRNNRTAVFTTELLDEFEEILKDTDPKQAQPGMYRFDQRDAGYLKDFAERVNGRVEGAAGVQDWSTALPFAREFAPPDLGTLGDQLRTYQKDGVTWLYSLSKNGLHGILADEMGLGKTVQTLAFLRLLQGPKLVVCPASLTLNWLRETQRFAPDLEPVLSNDLEPSELAAAAAKGSLLIASYGLLRRDIQALRSLNFTAAVLDEAQHIKNPDSQTAKAAHQLRAPARLALTGTPIENGVRDIWSIMQFLMPGYLGNRERFKERFETPIHQQPGGAAHRRLIQRLRPFILRRTKSQVAKELPEKIIQVSECELTKSQRNLYGDLLKAARSTIADASGPGADGKAKIAAFTALLRLRQVCCDPRLILPEDELGEAESAKLELLMELVSDAVEDGHQVLVFSQFARMLRLIGRALEPAGVPYCYLDGSTRNRQAEVDRFQAGGAPVFLISLKAGGVGLNLTKADTVILYDPWWNPAVEAQAMDRAHRIGQERAVTVYKLIARGTVEEKILNLQAKKKELSDNLVENEQPMMEGLDLSDLGELLE